MSNTSPLAKLVWHDPLDGRRFEFALLPGAVVTIGRSARNTIHLPEKHVSREHAIIQCGPDHCVIVDVTSSNGTYVNDEPVQEKRPLLPGDVIRLHLATLQYLAVDAVEDIPAAPGAAVLLDAAPLLDDASTPPPPAAHIEDTDEGAPATITDAEDDTDEAIEVIESDVIRAHFVRALAGDPGFPALVIVSGIEQGRIIPLDADTLEVGRATSDAQWPIQLYDVSVSRPHARLVREDENWLLYDLNSSNGTSVNELPVKGDEPYKLHNDDLIAIGGVLLRFREHFVQDDAPPTYIPTSSLQ